MNRTPIPVLSSRCPLTSWRKRLARGPAAPKRIATLLEALLSARDRVLLDRAGSKLPAPSAVPLVTELQAALTGEVESEAMERALKPITVAPPPALLPLWGDGARHLSNLWRPRLEAPELRPGPWNRRLGRALALLAPTPPECRRCCWPSIATPGTFFRGASAPRFGAFPRARMTNLTLDPRPLPAARGQLARPGMTRCSSPRRYPGRRGDARRGPGHHPGPSRGPPEASGRPRRPGLPRSRATVRPIPGPCLRWSDGSCGRSALVLSALRIVWGCGYRCCCMRPLGGGAMGCCWGRKSCGGDGPGVARDRAGDPSGCSSWGLGTPAPVPRPPAPGPRRSVGARRGTKNSLR